jgi:hypothetical protein
LYVRLDHPGRLEEVARAYTGQALFGSWNPTRQRQSGWELAYGGAGDLPGWDLTVWAASKPGRRPLLQISRCGE